MTECTNRVGDLALWFLISEWTLQEYYQELQTCAGIVPAFGHTRYLHSAASSTLFTSVLLGIPVIADDEMLEKYSYLTKEAVLYQGPNETVFDVMARYVDHNKRREINLISSNLIRVRNLQLRRNKVIFQRLLS